MIIVYVRLAKFFFQGTSKNGVFPRFQGYWLAEAGMEPSNQDHNRSAHLMRRLPTTTAIRSAAGRRKLNPNTLAIWSTRNPATTSTSLFSTQR